MTKIVSADARPSPTPLVNNLDDLAATVRAEHAAAGHAARDFLEHVLTAGDALIAAQKQLAPGQWLDWLKHKCDLKVRTAQRYMQLARNRAALEVDASRVTHPSLRGALKLVGARKKSNFQNGNKPLTSFDAIGWWTGTPLEARRHFIASIELGDFLEAMPPAWAPVLERRVLGQAEQRRRREEAEAATPLKSIAIADDDGLDIPTPLDRRITAAPHEVAATPPYWPHSRVGPVS